MHASPPPSLQDKVCLMSSNHIIPSSAILPAGPSSTRRFPGWVCRTLSTHAALFLLNGVQQGKERRPCRDETFVPLLAGTRDNPFCPYRTEESGLLRGPSSSHHLCFDDSLQNQSSAASWFSSSLTTNGLRNHQPLSSPSAPLLPGLAREGPM